MTDTLPKIRQFLESTKLEFEVMDCNPKLADTKVFCKEYGIDLEDSVNAFVVKTKTSYFFICVKYVSKLNLMKLSHALIKTWSSFFKYYLARPQVEACPSVAWSMLIML